MKISIDKEKCIKCGLCASICPDFFVLEDDGIKVTENDNILAGASGDKVKDDLKMAKESCPVGGVIVEE